MQTKRGIWGITKIQTLGTPLMGVCNWKRTISAAFHGIDTL